MTLTAARYAGRTLERLMPPSHSEPVDAAHLATLAVALATGGAELIPHREPWDEWRHILATSDQLYYHVLIEEKR